MAEGAGIGDGESAGSGRLSAWATLVRRTRWATAAAVIVVLGLLALPLLSMRLGQSDASTDPPGSTTGQAYQMLSDGFGPGFTGPLLVAATLPAPSDTAALGKLASSIRSEPGVASVSPPRVSPAGTAAVLQVYPATSPQAAGTSDLVSQLRSTAIPRATDGTGVTAYVGGRGGSAHRGLRPGAARRDHADPAARAAVMPTGHLPLRPVPVPPLLRARRQAVAVTLTFRGRPGTRGLWF